MVFIPSSSLHIARARARKTTTLVGAQPQLRAGRGGTRRVAPPSDRHHFWAGGARARDTMRKCRRGATCAPARVWVAWRRDALIHGWVPRGCGRALCLRTGRNRPNNNDDNNYYINNTMNRSAGNDGGGGRTSAGNGEPLPRGEPPTLRRVIRIQESPCAAAT